MAKNTVIITERGQAIDSPEDWWFDIDVRVLKYKTPKFKVRIIARKEDNSFQTTDKIIICDYPPESVLALDQVCSTLQSLLKAIANGEALWDARESSSETIQTTVVPSVGGKENPPAPTPVHATDIPSTKCE